VGGKDSVALKWMRHTHLFEKVSMVLEGQCQADSIWEHRLKSQHLHRLYRYPLLLTFQASLILPSFNYDVSRYPSKMHQRLFLLPPMVLFSSATSWVIQLSCFPEQVAVRKQAFPPLLLPRLLLAILPTPQDEPTLPPVLPISFEFPIASSPSPILPTPIARPSHIQGARAQVTLHSPLPPVSIAVSHNLPTFASATPESASTLHTGRPIFANRRTDLPHSSFFSFSSSSWAWSFHHSFRYPTLLRTESTGPLALSSPIVPLGSSAACWSTTVIDITCCYPGSPPSRPNHQHHSKPIQ
jgi:hypothetical protein